MAGEEKNESGVDYLVGAHAVTGGATQGGLVTPIGNSGGFLLYSEEQIIEYDGRDRVVHSQRKPISVPYCDSIVFDDRSQTLYIKSAYSNEVAALKRRDDGDWYDCFRPLPNPGGYSGNLFLLAPSHVVLLPGDFKRVSLLRHATRPQVFKAPQVLEKLRYESEEAVMYRNGQIYFVFHISIGTFVVTYGLVMTSMDTKEHYMDLGLNRCAVLALSRDSLYVFAISMDVWGKGLYIRVYRTNDGLRSVRSISVMLGDDIIRNAQVGTIDAPRVWHAHCVSGGDIIVAIGDRFRSCIVRVTCDHTDTCGCL